MSKITIIDNAFVTLWYHPTEKIVHHQFHKKTVYGNYLREMLNRGAELLHEHNACKWLSDDRNHVILTPEDFIWGSKEWSPKVLGYGWKYWAIVKPTDEIGKMSIEQITYDYKMKGLIIEYFDDTEKAFEWLRNCK